MILPEEKKYKVEEEEHVVGILEDGSLLYEKKITGIVNMDTVKNKTIFFTDTTIKDLIDCNGWIYSDNVCRQKIGGYANNSSFSTFQWNDSSKELSMWSASVFNGQKYSIAIRYTKLIN